MSFANSAICLLCMSHSNFYILSRNIRSLHMLSHYAFLGHYPLPYNSTLLHCYTTLDWITVILLSQPISYNTKLILLSINFCTFLSFFLSYKTHSMYTCIILHLLCILMCTTLYWLYCVSYCQLDAFCHHFNKALMNVCMYVLAFEYRWHTRLWKTGN